jgi:penicillin-binding protein 1A
MFWSGKQNHSNQTKSGPGGLYIPWRWQVGKSDSKVRPPAKIENEKPRKIWQRLLGFVLFLGLTGTITGGCGGLYIFSRNTTGVPVMTSLRQFQPKLPSVIYARDGMKVGVFGSEKRTLVPIERIPKPLIYAFVAAEDDRFFQHGGVDPLGILRAVVKNLKSGRIRAGGSTLTQQVAKSFLFDRLSIKLKKGICRNDKQCGWRERCQSRPGAPFGRCVPRSFKPCGKEITIVYQGKPVRAYRGYTTLCDAHELCRPQCKDQKINMSGHCRQWICMPSAPKPMCSADNQCGFGESCQTGECKPDFKKQLADLILKLQQKGAEIRAVRAPTQFLQGLDGGFKRWTSKRSIAVFASQAAQIDPRKISLLPGVRSVHKSAAKSLRRKVREAILAVRLEKKFSKLQILWMYMSNIFLGRKSYGVQSAAQNYFGKNVWDLELAESAMIAGLPQAPSAYNPYRNFDKAWNRTQYVLKRMLELNYISKEDHDKAVSQKEILRKRIKTAKAPNDFRDGTPYITAEVRKAVQRKYGRERFLEGGLKVVTSTDPQRQMVARRYIRRGIEQLDMRQGYRGPLGIIPRKHWADAIKRATAFYGDKQLVPGRVYAGLVTSIDRSSQQVTVQVGRYKGILPVAGMRWARKPNEYMSYSRGRLVRVGNRLKTGYWILVEPVKSWKVLKTGTRSLDRKIPRSGLIFRLRQHPKVNGATLSIDPHTGYVDAMVGGYSYTRSQFNRAMYACRQPGSSFKPIVYTTALENGEKRRIKGKEEKVPITTGTVIMDAPLTHDSGKEHSGARYKPSNYTGKYEGEVTLRRALVSSMNIPAIKIMLRTGIDRVIESARKFGITTPLRREFGMALGQSCVRPYELTMFYAMLARKGLRAHPTLIKMVLGRHDQILEDNRHYDDPALSPESIFNRMEHRMYRKEERLISKQTAFLISFLLKQVVSGGTGFKARLGKGRVAAGKTGTTNDSFDVWFMGFTPIKATAVWLGFDKNERPLGAWETGGRTAAPVWAKYMKDSTRGQKWPDFKPPADIIWSRIDPKTGKLANTDTRNAEFLPFIKGTEPTQRVEKRTNIKAHNFYKQDY